MASRETFDLGSKWGRHNFFKSGIFGRKWSRHYVLKDTFGHHICAIIGHSKNVFQTRENIDETYDVCLRCYKRIRLSTQTANKEVSV